VSDVRAQLQSVLGSTYTLERELGGGGMSRVFVATETALNRSVVIKVIAPELLEGMSVERFAREVKVAARLQQPNIVPLLAAGDANGVPFYTMPFVRGESLRSRIASGATISVADAVHILRDVAQALAYAHGEGIVHRDIKPENVLLSGGAAVVTDFGIAKAIDISRTHDGDQQGGGQITLTAVGISLGTPAYMSPEQAAGDRNIDHRADIYAWGLIAWELLAGHHPFAGKVSLQALVAAQMTEIPAVLSSVRGDVPPALSDLIQRCLEKERSRRPASATELLAQLEQAISGGTRSAARAPSAESRWRARVIGIVVLAAVVVVGLTWKSRFAGSDKSLAIIPFTASSNDSVSAYLAEGIADEVTNQLSHIPGLRLAGRSSAARYAGKGAREAGESLHVAMVLDGAVRHVGDRFRVTAELSAVSDGHVEWRYSPPDVAATDISAVLDEIARAIAGQLQVTLADAAKARGTKDAQAYQLFLKGMYLYRSRADHIPEAVAQLEQATAKDPSFARAWAALSQARMIKPQYTTEHVGDVLPGALDAARRAVSLDSNLADAHGALGFVHSEAFEWEQAEAEFNRAIALDTNAAEPRFRLGITLLIQGRVPEAVRELRGAVVRDPGYFIARAYLGWAEFLNGQSEGLDDEREAVKQGPNASGALSVLAASFARLETPDSARYYARRTANAPTTGSSTPFGRAAYALARSGATDEAMKLTRRLEALPDTAWQKWASLSAAYAGFGASARGKMMNAMRHMAATVDGDGFPVAAAILLIGEFPADSQVYFVLHRYNLEPGLFVKHNGGR
jgi:serine/threonine-protein kinase